MPLRLLFREIISPLKNGQSGSFALPEKTKPPERIFVPAVLMFNLVTAIFLVAKAKNRSSVVPILYRIARPRDDGDGLIRVAFLGDGVLRVLRELEMSRRLQDQFKDVAMRRWLLQVVRRGRRRVGTAFEAGDFADESSVL
jgi:hypothetical protein